jgi:hypothetical protein
MSSPHGLEGIFEITTVAIGIEQRADQTARLQLRQDACQQRRLARQPQRQSLVGVKAASDTLVEACCLKQTCGDPTRKSLAKTGHQRKTGPQRPARRRWRRRRRQTACVGQTAGLVMPRRFDE